MIGSMLCLSSCQNGYFKDINLFNHETLSTKKQESRFDVPEILSNKKEEARFDFVDPEIDWDITVGVTPKDQVISKLKSENLQYELETLKKSVLKDAKVINVKISEDQFLRFAFEQNKLFGIYMKFKGDKIKQLKKLEQGKGTYFEDRYLENLDNKCREDAIFEVGVRDDMSLIVLKGDSEENECIIVSQKAVELGVKFVAEQERNKKDFLKRIDKIYNDTLNGKK